MAEDKRQNEIIRIQKKQRNFVILDKGFLNDDRLSFKAKGILAYLLSKPDGWKVIVKDLVNHAKDGRKSVYSGLRELKECGYYKKIPVRDETGGRIDHWESIVFECPEENPEDPKGRDENSLHAPKGEVDKNRVESASSLLTPFGHVEKGEIQNRQHNNNDSNNNKSSNHKSKSSQSQTEKNQGSKPDKTKTLDNDPQQSQTVEMKKEPSVIPTPASKGLDESSPQYNQDNYTTYLMLIQDNISYKYFQKDERDIELVDNFVSCMLDVILIDKEPIIINKEKKPRSLVKAVYLKLQYKHILYAIDQYKAQHHQITYKHAYIKNMLYNSYLEIDAHYTNQVRADGVVW